MKELDPLKQAYREVPRKLVERIIQDHYYLAFPGIGISIYLLIYSFVPRFAQDYLVGGAIYMIGALADNFSTIKFIDSVNNAENLGIDREIREGNLIFGKDIATSADFLKSKKHWAVELLYAGVVMSMSPAAGGVATGVTRGVAALSNLRISKRMNRAISISQERSGH